MATSLPTITIISFAGLQVTFKEPNEQSFITMIYTLLGDEEQPEEPATMLVL